MADKFLQQFYELTDTKSSDYTQGIRRGWKKGKASDPFFKTPETRSLMDVEKLGLEILGEKDKYSSDAHQSKKGYAMAIANELMNKGGKIGALQSVYVGARIYEGLGLGKKKSVKRRLLRGVEKLKEGKDLDLREITNNKRYHGRVKDFLERNQTTERENLEEKASLVLIGGGILVSLFFLSTNITGHSIANLTQTNNTWIGIILLGIFLIAFFTHNKKH